MDIDDVAVDFPDMPIIMAHPSFPWQDEAISVCLHKPQVYIDLSGWSPKYFSPILIQYANTLLKNKMLFGSDYPLITPDRWLADFADIAIRDEVRPAHLERKRRAAVFADANGGATLIPMLRSRHTFSFRLMATLDLSAQTPHRARDLQVPFDGTPGQFNAITDVPGVTVGHTTLISGEGKLQRGVGPVRTGVTAILPRGAANSSSRVRADTSRRTATAK